ncbi:MAG TPA: DUF805 domain-containing protein [Rhizomicrobium sp.]|jgi:uncharacterized membrane protein YhaH (DUF805 family)|nr:DUF805 domain-containing protein [Rhizomicrobium sp.]
MDWGHYLFGFSGRINRAKIWLFILLTIVAQAIFFALLWPLAGFSFLGIWHAHDNPAAAIFGGLSGASAGLLTIGFYVAVFIAGLAVTVKRLHDRNKSAWWLIIFYVLPWALNMRALSTYRTGFHNFGLHNDGPFTNIAMHMGSSMSTTMGLQGGLLSALAFVLTVWAFVELYLLRGTIGDNRFGPDPLAGKP